MLWYLVSALRQTIKVWQIWDQSATSALSQNMNTEGCRQALHSCNGMAKPWQVTTTHRNYVDSKSPKQYFSWWRSPRPQRQPQPQPQQTTNNKQQEQEEQHMYKNSENKQRCTQLQHHNACHQKNGMPKNGTAKHRLRQLHMRKAKAMEFESELSWVAHVGSWHRYRRSCWFVGLWWLREWSGFQFLKCQLSSDQQVASSSRQNVKSTILFKEPSSL